MAITSEDLEAFHQFALARVSSSGAESLHELVDHWEVEHLSAEEQQETVSAVNAALGDMNDGDTGRPAEAISDELREELDRSG